MSDTKKGKSFFLFFVNQPCFRKIPFGHPIGGELAELSSESFVSVCLGGSRPHFLGRMDIAVESLKTTIFLFVLSH